VTAPRRRLFRSSSEFRWRRVASIVLVVAGAGGVAWLLLDAHGLAEPIRVLAASRFAVVDALAPERAAAVHGATGPKGERDPGLTEVCGFGWVDRSADAGAIDPSVLAAIPGIEESFEALVERLRHSPDPFTHAAGTLVEIAARSGAESEAALDSLAHQATTTSDARLYAVAFRACRRAPADGSCALLSAAQWARVDEGNGEPWLFILDEAAARGDRSMVDEALYRIGSAARFDDRYFAVTGRAVAQAGSSDVDLMAARALTIGLEGVAAAQWLPLQRLTEACGGAALADANRSQLCDAVAATLAERSDSTLLTAIGASIGQRVGWPVERVVAVRALRLALLDSRSAVPDAQPNSGESYSCAGVRVVLARLARLAELGEPQLARDWMQASGKGFESFAAVAREQEARRSARAAENAEQRSSAAAASASASRPGG
jgi:hypothetical protein